LNSCVTLDRTDALFRFLCIPDPRTTHESLCNPSDTESQTSRSLQSSQLVFQRIHPPCPAIPCRPAAHRFDPIPGCFALRWFPRVAPPAGVPWRRIPNVSDLTFHIQTSFLPEFTMCVFRIISRFSFQHPERIRTVFFDCNASHKDQCLMSNANRSRT